jgi:nicotinate-nucleotide pyrophosphorylase (carboxylating)
MSNNILMDIDRIIEIALQEDIGDGDHTSLALFPSDAEGKAKLLVKEHGILAGIPIVERVFKKADPSLTIKLFKNDGDAINKGDIAFEIKGKILSILATERLVLNFLQRLSGIATTTSLIVSMLGGLKTKILDTRKTTPTLRELEKYAVRVGGGFNHRMGLFDMILIKDNHVDFAGGVRRAIDRVHKYLERTGKNLKIEIEVRNFEELLHVIDYGNVDRIMLDNFEVDDLRAAIQLINGRFETEASGGIRIQNIRKYAETGVDFISIGALTHNIQSLDMSLKASMKSVWDED